MRSKTGWNALLLAAGVVLAPTAAWAQMGVDKPADPVVPLPLYHPRADVVGGIYTALEFVMYRQTNPIGHQLIAVRGLVDVDGAITGDLNGTVVNTDVGRPFIIRGPVVPGNFLGSGLPALFTDSLRGQETFQPGWKLTIGYRFDNGSALEASWTHLVSAKYYANAGVIPTNFANLGGSALLADTFLFSPVSNFPLEFAGPTQDNIALGNPQSAYGIWNGADNMSIDFTQRYDQGDIIGRVPLFQDDCLRCYGLAGGRFSWIWERFHWRTFDLGFDLVAPTGVGTSGQQIIQVPNPSGGGTIPVVVSTPQDVVAGQVIEAGNRPQNVANYTNIVSNRMYGPTVGFGVERYIGYGFALGLEMSGSVLVDIAKERAQYELGDKSIAAKKAATAFAVTPEVNTNVQLYWYPIEGIQIRAGYNFMAIFNTIAAPDPVAFDFLNLDPDWKNKPVRFFDGFNAGIGFIF
jgi:hypothetical protein